MPFTALTLAETDSESPVTDPLMAKIKDDFDYLKAKTDGIPATAWSGLQLTAGIDTNHDVTVAAGSARDTGDTATMVLAAAQTKQLDARWVSGDAAGGLANAALISANVTVSFDNATSKIICAGLFGGAGAGDTIIVVGSPANSGIHEVTAATADDATLSVAPTTEGAGASVTVYIIKASHQYDLFIADDGAGGVELGFDDSLTAANFLALAGVGTTVRCIGYINTDASANISAIVWIGDDVKTRIYTASATWRKTAMLRAATLEAQGASGGSGGANSAAGASGGGAGAGTWGRKYDVPASVMGTTETITVGAGGTAGAATATVAGTGGLTSIGAQLSCPAGLGGTGAAGVSIADGPGGAGGGAATGADVSIIGQSGTSGGMGSSQGGDSGLGRGGTNPVYVNAIGAVGTGPGAGPAGSIRVNNNQAGRVGTDGIAIIVEYFA